MSRVPTVHEQKLVRLLLSPCDYILCKISPGTDVFILRGVRLESLEVDSLNTVCDDGDLM